MTAGKENDARALGSSYVISAVIGHGATGQVWRGIVRETGEPIAAKVLADTLTREPEVVARFIRERSLLTRVSHRNVVAVLDLVVEGETLAIVTDLVDGPSLRTVLTRSGTLRPKFAVELCEQILSGLEAVHREGLVHRDLKPENILIEQTPEGDARARIVDFGIAQLAHVEVADSGDVVGSVEYIAPELLEGGPATPASDLYAVGIVLYELVCGRTPFASADPTTVMRRQIYEPAGRLAGMPIELWAVLQQLLAKDPARRPASVADALALLSGVHVAMAPLAALPVAEPDDPVVMDGNETIITPRRQAGAPSAPSEPDGAPPRRTRVKPMLAIGSVVVLGVAGAFVATRPEPASAATLVSAPERGPAYGTPVVSRTMRVESGQLVVDLTARGILAGTNAVTEYVPTMVGRRTVTLDGKTVGIGADRKVLVRLARGAKVDHHTYRVPVQTEHATSFLDRYEAARVALLVKDATSPTTVTDVAGPRLLRIPSGHQRVWLHLRERSPRGLPVDSSTASLGDAWPWESSRPDVAVVANAVASRTEAGRVAGRRYWTVVGLRPGRAVISTRVAGERVEIPVEVSKVSTNDLPCEAGVPLTAVSPISATTGAAGISEGALLTTDGKALVVDGGRTREIQAPDDELCAGASVVDSNTVDPDLMSRLLKALGTKG